MDKKLEAISLMRFLPAGAANMGEGVTREQLREAGLGRWSAPCGRTDDVRSAEERAAAAGLEGYDVVLPQPEDASEAPTAPGGPVIRIRFQAG
jgi:hypothetical protein